MKYLIEKILAYACQECQEYLVSIAEATPEERQERINKLKEQVKNISEAVRKKIEKLSIALFFTVIGLAFIMLFAIAVSIPMRDLIMELFKDSKPISEAFYDFFPKLYQISVFFAATFGIVAGCMKLYGRKSGIKASLKVFIAGLYISAGIQLLALAAAFMYSFATGDANYVLSMFIKPLICRLATPEIISSMFMLGAIIFSLYFLTMETKEAVAGAPQLFRDISQKLKQRKSKKSK